MRCRNAGSRNTNSTSRLRATKAVSQKPPEAAGESRDGYTGRWGSNDRRRAVASDREHAMSPAFADERRAAVRACAESIAQAVGERFDRSGRRIEQQDAPAAAALEKIGRPLVDAAALGAVGRDQHAVRRRRERVDGIEVARKERARLWRRRIGVDPHFPPLQRHSEASGGHAGEGGDRLIEGSDFGRRVSVEAQKPSTVGQHHIDAVGRKILRRSAFENRFRLLELLVRLQGAVERGHRDGRVAPPEETVGEFPQRADHEIRPHRFSYWTKFRSAPSSLYRPMRLLAMPPR